MKAEHRTHVHTTQYLKNPIKAKAEREIDYILLCSIMAGFEHLLAKVKQDMEAKG